MVMMVALASNGPLSGKTTLARYLEKEHGFLRVNHSQTLAEHFILQHNLKNGESEPLTLEKLYAEKEYWRPYLQQFSLSIGFSSPVKSLYWTQETLRPWFEQPWRNVVFEPFRGEVQKRAMRYLGFTIVQISIPEEVRQARARALGRDYTQIVASMDAYDELERGVRNPDLELYGNRPLEELAQAIFAEVGDVRIYP